MVVVVVVAWKVAVVVDVVFVGRVVKRVFRKNNVIG